MAGKKPAAKKEVSSKVGQVILIENGSGDLTEKLRFKTLSQRKAAVKANLGKSQSLSDFLSKAGWY